MRIRVRMATLTLVPVVVIALMISGAATSGEAEALKESVIAAVTPEFEKKYAELEAKLKINAQTLAWQQQMVMEGMRMNGDSGIHQVRNVFGGTRPWVTNTWTRRNGQAAIHNHANHIRTVGMGEFAAVMNGVSFRTRHNDYILNKAHGTSSEYGATEPVDFPEVPKSVTDKETIPEQIAEMREYFKAFATQNSRHRDYKPYFKPVLSYIQGMWTVGKNVEEPFFSDRHSINADTWFDLQKDVMFSAWTGKKDVGENLAVLPTMIYGVHDDGTPSIAQWNYKILTHPIDVDVSLSRFRIQDDITAMMRASKSIKEMGKTRNARYQLHPSTDPEFDGVWREEKDTGWENFLEQLMNKVPGMDNYQASILDSNFGAPPLKKVQDTEEDLNAGYYHRYYSLAGKDASGFSKSARGFADSNLFVALNNQSKIAPIQVSKCKRWKGKKTCQYEEVRVSYAMPLEVIFLTPLHRWNPYEILLSSEKKYPTFGPDGRPTRTGRQNDPMDAYNGASNSYYYRTPAELFEGVERNGDTADTVRDSVYILDKDDNVRKTVASGTWIFLPEMRDVGTVRIRYPIFGVYEEGNAAYKELSAVKDLVRKGATYGHLYENPLGGLSTTGDSGLEKYTFHLRSGIHGHTHSFQVTANELVGMMLGNGYPGFTVKIETSTKSNHAHTLILWMKPGRDGLWIFKCDGKFNTCRDKHPSYIDCVNCPPMLLKRR